MTPSDGLLLFDTRARAHLRAVGQRGSRAEVQRVLGVTSAHYAAYLSGRRGTWDTLVTWVSRWCEAGHPPLGVLALVAARVERVRPAMPVPGTGAAL